MDWVLSVNKKTHAYTLRCPQTKTCHVVLPLFSIAGRDVNYVIIHHPDRTLELMAHSGTVVLVRLSNLQCTVEGFAMRNCFILYSVTNGAYSIDYIVPNSSKAQNTMFDHA